MGTLTHFDLVGIAAPFRSPTARRRGPVEQFWPGAFARACADTWNEIRIDHRDVVVNGGRQVILLAECALGLFVAIRTPDRTRACALRQAANRGGFAGMSIALDRDETAATVRNGVRTITDAGSVVEISLVTTHARPVYADTWVMSTDTDAFLDRLWRDRVAESERCNCYAFSNVTREQRRAQLLREQSPEGERARALNLAHSRALEATARGAQRRVDISDDSRDEASSNYMLDRVDAQILTTMRDRAHARIRATIESDLAGDPAADVDAMFERGGNSLGFVGAARRRV